MTEHDLKKQSQFADAEMNVKSVNTMDYDDFAALRLRKNKANQSQFQNPAQNRMERNIGSRLESVENRWQV
jgi:hypothetical protein